MTYKELSELIMLYDIPSDVTLKSDSGWEIDATDMDGVFYNPEENVIVFTMDMADTRREFYAQEPWVTLEPWRAKAKAVYLEREVAGTYIEAYKVSNELYVVHGEEYLYGLDRDFNVLWTFSGRDILVTQDGTPAVKVFKNHLIVTDWLGYRYRVNIDGSSSDVTKSQENEISWFGFTSGEVELACMSYEDAKLLLDVCQRSGIGCEHVSASDYQAEPFWYVKDAELVITRYTLENDSICECSSVSDYIFEHTK